MKLTTILLGLLAILGILCTYLSSTRTSHLEPVESLPVTPEPTTVVIIDTVTPTLKTAAATATTSPSPTIVLTEESQTPMSEPGISQTQEGLFIDSALKGDLDRSNEPTVTRSRFVKINFDILVNSNTESGAQPDVAKTLPLNLFEDVFFVAVLDHVESNSPSSLSWVGHLEGIENSQVILVIEDKVMFGNITLPGAIYEIQYAGNDIHGIYEIDQSAFGPD